MAAALWRADCPSLEQSIQVEGLRQKGEAIREIGSRLAQDHSVYDHEMAFLMSTMATLVLVEVCDGGFNAAEMHLKGVYNLFRLGGGYHSFKDQFILCKSINLADIQVSTALGQGLVFPLMQTDQPQLLSTTLEHTFDPPLHDSVANATKSSTISVNDQRTLLNI
ncbi:hypothetical protein CEP54_013507 [Fusarium duplospermum]|uniref:Uncharacterized protein n=1 Tax=Fusarium duplospermum TaxID=1325734 RepID=A0A428P2D7_9HYPO|nr:hypothetical protein CEP54_013507 [Fusarium duplospermum]